MSDALVRVKEHLSTLNPAERAAAEYILIMCAIGKFLLGILGFGRELTVEFTGWNLRI